MVWVRIDENFARHPKVLQAGPLGLAMQVAALCYCNQHLTDGFVPRMAAKTLLDFDGLGMRLWSGEVMGGGEDASWDLVVADLVSAGLWAEVENGYRIHDYDEYQPSKAAVLAERDRKRAAGRLGGRARAAAQAESKQPASGVLPEAPEADGQAESKPVPVPVPSASNEAERSPRARARAAAQAESKQPASGVLPEAPEADGQAESKPVPVPVPSASNEAERSPRARARAREKQIPDDWRPNERHYQLAGELGVDIARETEQFRDHALANGRTQVDWDRAFFTWLRNANPRQPAGGRSPPQPARNRIERQQDYWLSNPAQQPPDEPARQLGAGG